MSFKKRLISLYSIIYVKKIRIINFLIPNFFCKNRISFKSIPYCEQKTLITGKGKVEIGKNSKFGLKLGGFYRNGCIELQSRNINSIIKIGNDVKTNNNLFICACNYIEIGDAVLIGQNVTIMDFEAHGIEPSKRNQMGEIESVIISENVWIGNNVTILKGSMVGKNSIIAAGAIVKGVFPENVIIGGIPAKIIKQI